ncbi:MAG: DedA family protein [Syntrophorhabdus sp.]
MFGETIINTGGLIEHFTYIGIFCLLILGGVGFPFPEDGVIIIAGVLIAQQVINFIPAIAIIYPSVLLADFILYSIGRRYGKAVLRHKRFSKIISEITYNKFEVQFNRWGSLMIVAGRHLAGLRAPIFLASGMVGVSRLKFVLVDSVSAIFSVSIMLGIGYFGGSSLAKLSKRIAHADHLIILIITACITVLIIISFFRHRRKERLLRKT